MIEQPGAHGGVIVDTERATIERDGTATAQHRVLGQDVDQRCVPAHERPGVQQDGSVTAPGHLVVDRDVIELDVIHHPYLSSRRPPPWRAPDLVGARRPR
jgi:hypothetical protein